MRTLVPATTFAGLLLAFAVPLCAAAQQENGHTPDDTAQEIARLRAHLEKPGADGREAREQAVERLLAMPVIDAHRELYRVLARSLDADGLRLTVLRSLSRHLLGVESAWFGGAESDVRRQIHTLYLGVLSRWWLPSDEAPVPAELRSAAVEALQRIPARAVEQAAGTLLAGGEVAAKVAVLTCLADLQSLYLSQVLADHVEDEDLAVRAAARRALRLLTFQDEEFATRAQFAAWYEQNGDVRYVDLAERSARGASKRDAEIRAEVERAWLARSRDLVRAYATPSQGINWAAIRKETIVADPARMQACLEVLQELLVERVPTEEGASARVELCRALLDSWRQTPAERAELRACLLEVAAYCVRRTETELASTIQGHLLAALDSSAIATQLGALRGLRRFVSPEVRGAVVRYALAAVPSGDAVASLRAALATLSSRLEPRWTAPKPDAPDKAQWLELVRAIFTVGALAELRDAALTLALLEHADGARLPEVFALVLEVAQDAAQSPTLRCKCIQQVLGWKSMPDVVRLVAAMQGLIGDADVQVRQQAATALSAIVQRDDPTRSQWAPAAIEALRKRLALEPNLRVLEHLAESLFLASGLPQMAGTAIAGVNAALAAPPPEGVDANERREILVSVLTRIAGQPAAGDGAYLDACEKLVELGNRLSLRLLLTEKHGAMNLAEKVQDADAALAARARRAMQMIIRTAQLKPSAESWRDAGLRGEAHDVITAFRTLDKVSGAALQGAESNLLRLDVELAADNFSEVVQRANAWLAAADSPGAIAWTPAQKDRMLLALAEARLGQKEPKLAADRFQQCDAARRLQPRDLDLATRIAVALPEAHLPLAVALLDRVRKATPPTDPTFRARLVAWATIAVRQDPKVKAAVWKEVQPHAALFDESCPEDLRQAFAGLRVDG